jgi:hypothetical protein
MVNQGFCGREKGGGSIRIRLRQATSHGNVLCSIRRGVRSIVGDEEKEVV